MPLAFVDRGIESFTGSAVWLEAHKQNEFRYRPAQDQTALARFGELTASTVLQILLPLLIILLAFTAFAGERESGTLRQVLSLGVRPSELAFGKVLGIVGVLGLLLVPAVVIGVVALNFAADDGESAPDFGRMILLSVSYLLYLGIFLAVALAVSARASSARLALLGLLGFWIVSCLIAPRVATDIARRASPTPSAFVFAQLMDSDMKNGTDGHNPADKRLDDLKRATRQQYGVSKLEDLPVSFDGISLQASEDFGYSVFDKHYGNLWTAFESQDKVRQISAVLAPQLAVASLSRGLAGTDFAQHRDFARAAETHRRNLIKIINEDVMHNARYGDTNYKTGADLWQKVPEFQYTAPDMAWVVRRQICLRNAKPELCKCCWHNQSICETSFLEKSPCVSPSLQLWFSDFHSPRFCSAAEIYLSKAHLFALCCGRRRSSSISRFGLHWRLWSTLLIGNRRPMPSHSPPFGFFS